MTRTTAFAGLAAAKMMRPIQSWRSISTTELTESELWRFYILPFAAIGPVLNLISFFLVVIPELSSRPASVLVACALQGVSCYALALSCVFIVANTINRLNISKAVKNGKAVPLRITAVLLTPVWFADAIRNLIIFARSWPWAFDHGPHEPFWLNWHAALPLAFALILSILMICGAASKENEDELQYSLLAKTSLAATLVVSSSIILLFSTVVPLFAFATLLQFRFM
jgi:hypothetical protein